MAGFQVSRLNSPCARSTPQSLGSQLVWSFFKDPLASLTNYIKMSTEPMKERIIILQLKLQSRSLQTTQSVNMQKISVLVQLIPVRGTQGSLFKTFVNRHL